MQKNLSLSFLVLIVTVFKIPSSFAQVAPAPLSTPIVTSTHQVTLKILGKGNGRVVSHAEIKSGSNVVFSDPNGVAVLMIPLSATGTIAISRHGYKAQDVNLSVLANIDTYDIYLEPGEPDDNEVIIRGNKRPEVSRKTVSASEAARIAPNGDPAQITKLLPGVQASAFQPDIAVRGSGPQDSRYYIDAFEVPDLYHRIGNISVLPEELLADVEFSTGGFGAQYGDATGGIIVLRSKNEIPEYAKTDFRLNIPFYSAAYHERPLDKDSSVAVSVRHSTIEYVLPPILKKANADATVVPYFADAHVAYTHKVDDGYTKILAMGSMDGLKLVAPIDSSTSDDGRGEVDIFSGFGVLGVEHAHNMGEGWSYTASPEIIQQNSRINFLDSRVNLTVSAVHANVEFKKHRSKNENIYFGVEPQVALVKADIYAPLPPGNDKFYDPEEAPKQAVSKNYQFKDIATWFGYDQAFGDLLLSPGIRTFYFDTVRKSGYDPRLNARYKLTEATALKGAIGQYSKSPSAQETNAEFGNPDMSYERSYHYVLGVESNWTDRWTADFQLFNKRIIRVTESSAEKHYEDSGTITSRGFEAFVRRNMTERVFGWLSYTYSITKERINDDESFHPGQYDETHVLNLAGDYKLTAIWELGGRVGYHTGDVFTPVNDEVYNVNLDKYQPRQGDTVTNSDRLPAFQQIDLYATRDFLMDTWKMGLRFGVQYLAFTKQAYGIQYNYDYSKREYFSSVPPIPFIEVRGEI